MDPPLLQTKLYIPVIRPDPAARLRTSLVPRPHLIDRLNESRTLGDLFSAKTRA